MLRRRGLIAGRGELPAGYRRCKYLESSGTQYIDTGVTIDEEYMNIKVKYDVVSYTLCGALGSFNPQTFDGFSFWSENNHIKLLVGRVNHINIPDNSKSIYDFHIVAQEKRYSISYNEDVVSGEYRGSVISGKTIYLFSNNNGIYKYNPKLKMYRFSVTKSSGKKAMNVVPALDPSGRPCMFDMVSKQPFYNQGIGEFGYELSTEHM